MQYNQSIVKFWIEIIFIHTKSLTFNSICVYSCVYYLLFVAKLCSLSEY